MYVWVSMRGGLFVFFFGVGVRGWGKVLRIGRECEVGVR